MRCDWLELEACVGACVCLLVYVHVCMRVAFVLRREVERRVQD